MPEGPEIRHAADTLNHQIAGRVIDRIYFGLESLSRWNDRLTGARVIQVQSYGKAMVIQLDNDLSIYSHNQLYGRWYCCDTQDYPDLNRQLRLAIDCQGRSALLYSASDIAVLDQEELENHPFLNKLGPDVLSSSTTVKIIVDRLMSDKYKNRQLGGLLTDQSFVAGLGNYLRCEVLYYSQCHPRTRSRDLNVKQINQLAHAIVDLSRQSYQMNGITNDPDRAQQLIQQGSTFEDARFYVFRRDGLDCYRCGDVIERISQAGQACYCCPTCQVS